MKTEEHGYDYCPLQKGVMINFTKEDCGWGGEAKLQKYSECNYNNYFEIIDRRWFDMKCLEAYSSGMSTHHFSFALDSLHYLACFWVCGDGL